MMFTDIFGTLSKASLHSYLFMAGDKSDVSFHSLNWEGNVNGNSSGLDTQ